MPSFTNTGQPEGRQSALQSRAMSLVEVIANVVVGYCLAVVTQVALFPILGLQLAIATNLIIGAVFTLVSIARSYVLRRLFENIRVRALKRGTAAR